MCQLYRHVCRCCFMVYLYNSTLVNWVERCGAYQPKTNIPLPIPSCYPTVHIKAQGFCTFCLKTCLTSDRQHHQVLSRFNTCERRQCVPWLVRWPQEDDLNLPLIYRLTRETPLELCRFQFDNEKDRAIAQQFHRERFLWLRQQPIGRRSCWCCGDTSAPPSHLIPFRVTARQDGAQYSHSIWQRGN